LLTTNRILTYAVVAVAISAAAGLAFSQFESASNSYSQEIAYSVQRLAPTYDYSCNEPVYGIHVTLKNNGTKTVSDFNVAISNPLCVESVPSTLPSELAPQSSINFYVSSTGPNGTVTVSGNNTLVEIRF
jgi:hypothetical protein